MDALIEQIIQNPLFLQLKSIVENNDYHDHEDVYSHCLKVKNTAQKEIKADFITNPDAKNKYLEFTEEDFHGYKRADIIILVALIHDIGKILQVKENGKTQSLLVTNSEGKTSCPGHEYWGSTIASEVIKDLSLPKEITDYIAAIIRSHDIFNPLYWDNKKDWPIETLLNDVKSRAEGLYKEAMFNQYCDCFTAAPFQRAKEMIIKVFNEPDLYERREYVLS